jgi:hypothetical protein
MKSGPQSWIPNARDRIVDFSKKGKAAGIAGGLALRTSLSFQRPGVNGHTHH